MPERKPDEPVRISEADLVAIVNRFYDAARLAREQSGDGMWQTYMQFFRSRNIWPSNMAQFRTKINANHARRIIYHKVGLMTYSRPKIVVEPAGEGATREGAQVLQSALDSIALDQQEMRAWPETLLMAAIYGVSERKCWYDPWDNPPFGRIRTGPINPAFIYPDPHASKMDECRYFIYSRVLPVEEIFQRYGIWVEPEDEVSDVKDEDKKGDGGTSWYSAQNELRYAGRRMARIKECLWKDPTTVIEDVPIEGKTYKIIKLKYPYGRKTVVAGKRVLRDGEAPYKRWEFSKLAYYAIPGNWMGIGEVENLMTLQLDVDKGLAGVAENRNLTANIPWIADDTSGVTAKMIVNRGGLVIVKRQGTEVRMEAPPSLPGYVLQNIGDNENRMETLAGVMDFQMLRKPITHVSGATVTEEQTAGHTSIRLQLLDLETMMAEEGLLKIEMIRKHWTRAREVLVADETGPSRSVSFDPLLTRDGNYSVRVGHGSTLPVSRTKRRDEALALYQAGVLDKEEVLYLTDVPDRETIVERMQKREQDLLAASRETSVSPANIAQPTKGRLPAGAIR